MSREFLNVMMRDRLRVHFLTEGPPRKTGRTSSMMCEARKATRPLVVLYSAHYVRILGQEPCIDHVTLKTWEDVAEGLVNGNLFSDVFVDHLVSERLSLDQFLALREALKRLVKDDI